MDQRMATTLIEAAFSEPIDGTKPAWDTFIDKLVERSAEVMTMSDEALMQTEADLKNLRTASVQVVDAPKTRNQDEDLRVQASRGNLQLAPTAVEPAVATDDRRNKIRAAMGTTKVATLTGNL
jgi:hypothetical protein